MTDYRQLSNKTRHFLKHEKMFRGRSMLEAFRWIKCKFLHKRKIE